MERLHQSISFLTCWKLRHAPQEVHSLNEEELEMQNIAEIAAPLNGYNAISNIISDNMSTSDNYSGVATTTREAMLQMISMLIIEISEEYRLCAVGQPHIYLHLRKLR